MKLAFPNGERDDFAVGKGSFSIGGADEDDIVIGSGPRAILTVDQRGITLSLDEPANDAILVNSRPIRSKAILRLGDHIRIGPVDMVLRGDVVDMRTPPPFEAMGEDLLPARMHLRGISGRHAGMVFPIRKAITLSSEGEADVELSPGADLRLSVGWKDGRVYVLREGGEGRLDVNGHYVKHAEVNAGDQIAVGEDRFLVETPGFVPGDVYGGQVATENSGNTQVFSAAAFNAHREQQAAKAPAPDERAAVEEKPASGDTPSGRLRDGIIIGVCVLLSAAMIGFLLLQL